MDVKICGIGAAADLDAAVAGGAAYVGFVFYPPSPRSLAPAAAAALASRVPAGIRRVGLFVDPEDAMLDAVVAEVPLEYVQLHGTETPERVAALRNRTGLPMIKAVRIGRAADLGRLAEAEESADMVLCDAAAEGMLPGGNGEPFDWALLAGRHWVRPWFLAGGLTAENVAEAARRSGAALVDVSSGVEDRPGHKDPARIRGFLRAAGADGQQS